MSESRKITFQNIVNRYLDGKYDPPTKIGYPKQLPMETVIDEDKSVKWNREKVNSINAEKRAQYEEMKALQNALFQQYKDDLYAAAKYECDIHQSQAAAIYIYVMDHTEYDYVSVEFTIDYEKFCKFFARLRDMKEE